MVVSFFQGPLMNTYNAIVYLVYFPLVYSWKEILITECYALAK